jgi:hypothetical protein
MSNGFGGWFAHANHSVVVPLLLCVAFHKQRPPSRQLAAAMAYAFFFCRHRGWLPQRQPAASCDGASLVCRNALGSIIVGVHRIC